MPLAAAGGSDRGDFVIEDINTGVHASGFGRLGDGRSFSFRIHRGRLAVEIYRPRLSRPVPLPEDVVASSSRGLTDIDLNDTRSLSAAVRDAVAEAGQVSPDP